MVQTYESWESAMSPYPHLLWEPIEVTTQDGYILTQFHVWNPQTRDATTKGPIFFQHGAFMDAQVWVSWMDAPNAVFFQMADLGHDIYFGNTRGTLYSTQHTTYDYLTDAEFWDFVQDDLRFDVLANVESMYNHAGNGLKGWYFGYSQGTTQMLMALMYEEATLLDYLHRTILLAPAYLIGEPMKPKVDNARWMGTIGQLWDIGVYAIPSYTWESDLEKICDTYGWLTCRRSRKIDTRAQPQSAKLTDHYYQNVIAQRYQKFVENWSEDNWEGELYDLSVISQMPISLITGDKDETYPVHWQDTLADQLSTLQNYVTIPGGDHIYTFMQLSNEGYNNLLLDELTTEVTGTNRYYADVNGAGSLIPAVTVALAAFSMLFH